MDETSRRGFLARLGGIAAAPVLTAFVSDDASGLVVPDRQLANAPVPVVISSLMAPGPDWQPGQRIPAPHAQLVVWVEGVPYRLAAYRLA